MTATAYRTFYETTYRTIVKPTEEILGQAQHSSQYLGHKIAEWITRVMPERPSGLLLDIGCGDGIIGATIASDLGQQVVGLDPNPQDCQQAREQGIDIREGSFESLPKENFAGILCIRTFDHVLEPIRGLQQLAKRLVPGGWMWIDILETTKNRERFGPVGFWKIDHPFYWTEQTLRQTLMCTGWRVLDHGYASKTLYGAICQPKA